MATVALPVPLADRPAPSTPIQLRIFDRVPKGFIAHADTDGDALPLVEPGEVVVVDPYQPDVVEGALFVVEYGRGTHFPSRQIVEPRRCEDVEGGLAADCWILGPYGRPRSNAELLEQLARGRRFSLSDGPYHRCHANDKLIGRVVGIYQPVVRRAL